MTGTDISEPTIAVTEIVGSRQRTRDLHANPTPEIIKSKEKKKNRMQIRLTLK
jgi:hypothetical protein